MDDANIVILSNVKFEDYFKWLEKNTSDNSAAAAAEKGGDNGTAPPDPFTGAVRTIPIHDIPRIYHRRGEGDGSTTTKKRRCWYCERWHSRIPIFIPEVVTDTYIKSYGSFCSFNCAKMHILLSSMTVDARSIRLTNLSLLKRLTTQTDDDFIDSIPVKFEMKKYGGRLTTEEYYKTIHDFL
ncbi:MAG TPA: hypothetical protein VFQ26_07860 [Nitrospiraceae bacterium]|nr:hypothetical protein [Nitrospiraceae bacterium]